MEADALDFALGTILSQFGASRKLHPIAFHSRKLSAAKINYEIHDNELLVIMDSFHEWCHLLKNVAHQVTIYIDHKILSILCPPVY